MSKPELKHALGFEVVDEIDGFPNGTSVFEPYTPSDSSASTRSRPTWSLRVCDGRRSDAGPRPCAERVA